ncbi:MAG: hypothetical protein ACYCPS_03700 [Candidatus Saccharimonadales bacterium]
MGNLKNNEQGFSAVEIVLVVVIVALIGVVGWLVYKNHHKTITPNVATISNNKPATPTTTPKTPTNTVTYKTYSDSAAQASFQYPSTWTLTSIRGLCDEPNGCAPSTDHISAQQVTSPDSSVEIVWSGISGIGGDCNNNVPPTQSGGCNIETVFSSTPIPKADGLYVVEGAMEVSSGQYQPFLAVQDKNGVLTSGEQGLWYQNFKLPTTGNDTLFYMNNGYKDGGGGSNPQAYATTSQVQSYLNSSDVTQAKQILLSLQVQ